MHTAPVPFFSPPGDATVFCWHHAPVADARDIGFVLCPPIGPDLMSSYRSMRALALRLAEAGVHVLRLDYHGTGDSPGGDEDPGRVEAWLRSIDLGIDALKRVSGVARIGLIGVRLGGTLACVAAARREDVDTLVLWATCRTGKVYAREQRALRMAAGDARAAGDAAEGASAEEAGGFLLTRETISALAELDATRLARRPARRVLLVHRADLSPDAKLEEALTASGAEVSALVRPGLVEMMQAPHDAVIPTALFDEIATWIGTQHPETSTRVTPAVVHAPYVAPDGSFTERPLRFGPGARLFGLLSEPRGGAHVDAPTLILANTGANHHVGPNRMYVKFARRWAAVGRRVLRMDQSGIGDSELGPQGRDNQPYTSEAVNDLRSAIEVLRAHGARGPVIVMGLCSGAYLAFHGALEQVGLSAQVLVNPQTFYWHEGDSLAVAPGQTFDHVKYYRQSMFRLDRWKRLLSGQSSYRGLARTVVRRVRDVAAARVDALLRRAGVGVGEDVGRDLRKIHASGIETLVVFAVGDPGIDYMRLHGWRDFQALQRKPGFRVEYLTGPDHTFTLVAFQEQLFALLSEHLSRRYA